MSYKVIEFNNKNGWDNYFLGRNGTFKCSAICVYPTLQDSLWIVPITSKGEEGRCHIEIPHSSLPELAVALRDRSLYDFKTIGFVKQNDSNCYFLGRNGCFNCRSLNLYPSGVDSIKIAPVTSKGKEGRCFIEIPRSSLPDLVAAIQEILFQVETIAA